MQRNHNPIQAAIVSSALSLAALALPALAQSKPLLTPDETQALTFARSLSNAFKSVARTVEPSVVHITNLSKVYYRENFFDQGQERIVPAGLGSGVIVRTDGTVITNNHVIKGSQSLRVKLSDGREFDAKVIGRDEATDLAVLKIIPDPKATDSASPPTFPAVPFADSDSLDVGEWVVAIGSPFGLDNSVTQGIISAKGRSIAPRESGRVYEDFIQTDAAINPGNSGGPLLNLSGQIVGINSAIASRTGGYDGIGFAIPANVVKSVLENVLSNGRVIRGWLGVGLKASPINKSGESTVEVQNVGPGSPAEEAGLKEGDIITRFKGQPVTENKLRIAIAFTKPGETAELDIIRNGKPLTLTATLGDQMAAQGQRTVPQLGMTVQTITSDMARRARIRGINGVVILSVDTLGEGGTKRAQELQPNDIISAVDGDKVSDADEFAKLIERADFSKPVRLNVIRNGQRGYIDITD